MATYDLTSTTPTKIKTGDILNCPYSGSVQSITLPKGQYKLECWGAQGGSAYGTGGTGGYSKGILNLLEDTLLYCYSGGQRSSTAGGFNGGGDSFEGGQGKGSGGGGGSDIRVKTDSLYARIIVAGGGGGGSTVGNTSKTGGVGGGTSGGGTNPGTQTSTSYGNIFGQGTSLTAPTNQYSKLMARPAGGGGGGWYGGLATTTTQTTGGVNGGGSGYVYTADTEANYPTPMLVDGAYYLEDASTVNGNTSFASPTGTSEIGHSGNGYVRITVIKVKSGNVFLKESEGAWLEQKQMFVNTGASSTVSSGLVELDYIQSTGNQYINTGITPNGNTRVVFKFAPQDESATQCLFCSRKTTSGTDTYSYTSFYIGAHVRRDYYGTSYLSSDSYSKDTIVTLDANKNVTLINNESCFSSDFTLSSTSSVGPLILLASAYQSSASSALSSLGNYASIKLYSCQIYNNGTLVRNFVPAKRVSDGKCGLWDKVSYRFYVDENGGNFTAGTEKSTIASVGTSIEYIQSSGTQYINTNYIPNTKTKIIADFEVTTKQASNNDIIGVVGQFSFRQYGNADYFRTVSGTAVRDFDTSVSILDRHIVEKTYNFTKVDSYYIQTSASNVTFSYPVYLFAYNTGSSVANQGYLKLYSCKIYDGDTLVRDFIPIKTTVNTYGLWDRVNKVFYKNAGTGTFAGGSFISLSGWRPMKSVWVKTDSNTWEQAL